MRGCDKARGRKRASTRSRDRMRQAVRRLRGALCKLRGFGEIRDGMAGNCPPKERPRASGTERAQDLNTFGASPRLDQNTNYRVVEREDTDLRPGIHHD